MYAMAALLKFALANFPYLVDKVNADHRLVGDLKADPGWNEMLDKALKDKQKADDDKVEVAKKAKELKDYDDKIKAGIDPDPEPPDADNQAAPAPQGAAPGQ